MNYQIKIQLAGKEYYTLADILPEDKILDILFIAKTPAIDSVEKGHYFQGRQGKMFWKKLQDYNILKVPSNDFEDNYLLKNNFGITDIVKVPRNYGNEPSNEEYEQGMDRIFNIIEKYQPKIIVFVYKGVLDKIIKLKFNLKNKSEYGFNNHLENYFKTKVFVFPMPGTPCKSEEIEKSMIQLHATLKN